MTIKIGDIIWTSSGNPKRIVGETSRSWLLETEYEWQDNPKVPKKQAPASLYPNWFYSQEEMDSAMFARAHRHSIANDVSFLSDGALLRKIGEMIGWKPKEERR